MRKFCPVCTQVIRKGDAYGKPGGFHVDCTPPPKKASYPLRKGKNK